MVSAFQLNESPLEIEVGRSIVKVGIYIMLCTYVLDYGEFQLVAKGLIAVKQISRQHKKACIDLGDGHAFWSDLSTVEGIVNAKDHQDGQKLSELVKAPESHKEIKSGWWSQNWPVPK